MAIITPSSTREQRVQGRKALQEDLNSVLSTTTTTLHPIQAEALVAFTLTSLALRA